MYPLKDGLFAPRNQWYIAAWSSEVGRQPIERWILDQPVAMYRREDGAPVALHGRCPHRSFPLGRSRVDGDNLQCGYHGISFRPDGSCASIPTQAAVPSVCRVASYPIVERWRWLWIWMGDAERADEDLIPSIDALGVNDHLVVGEGYRFVKGRYMLLHDNLFDLTHLGYLHMNSFGGGSGAQNTVPKIETGPGFVRSVYTQLNVDVPPFHAKAIGYEGKADRIQGLTCYLPGIHVGGMVLTKPGKPDESIGSVLVLHGVTPATRHSSHYFFANGQDWSGDPEVSRKLFEFFRDVAVVEDAEATELVEEMIEKHGGRPDEILIKADNVCVTGRRQFERMIEADDAEPAVQPVGRRA